MVRLKKEQSNLELRRKGIGRREVEKKGGRTEIRMEEQNLRK